jgi:hypothetical protein
MRERQRRGRHQHTEQQTPHVARVPVATRYRMGTMGFNPYRKFRARPVDYVLLSLVFAVAIGLVIWAVVG